jgi:hypothetical protein
MAKQSHLGVVATHMAAASFFVRGGLAGVLSHTQRKAHIRKAIENMRIARVNAGIYHPNDFRKARLP